MKFRRFTIVLVLFSLVALIGNVTQYRGRNNIYSDNYPAVICPDIGNKTTLQVSLSNSQKLIRSLSRPSVKLVTAKSTRIASNSGSILVEGAGIDTLGWISNSGVWAGGVTCLSPQSQQYFVGGSADVSSKSQLVLANSGLSTSTVDVTVFSDSASFKKPLTVKKNQTLSVPLVTLAPGSKTVALQVVPRTGRITAYLVDERSKGLKALGGDLVNSQSDLHKTIYIPAIPHSLALDKTHVLRILNSNAANANISAELISSDGRYVPVGMDNASIASDRVVDIPFDVDSKNSAFGLIITSDQPIAASVYSRVQNKGKTDFVWSSAAPSGAIGTWAVTGLDPQLIAIGGSINVVLKVLMPGGKKIGKKLSGSDIAAYQIPSGALAIVVQASNSAIGLIVNSQSGTGYLPILNGSTLSRSTVPTANIGVLNP